MINPKAFLGDAAFDSIEIYKALFSKIHSGIIPTVQQELSKKPISPCGQV